MATKLTIKQRVFIGVSLSVVAFLLSKVVLAKYYKKKAIEKKSNFIGADGFYDADGGDGKFFAKTYDPNHRNTDGTLGATWISFNNSDVVGYWEKGKIQIGTEVSALI